MERDHQAYDLFRRGLSYRQVAAQLEYKSHSAAFDAVRRAARDNASDPLAEAEARQALLDRLQDYRRAAQRVLTARHYLVSEGRIVRGPDGEAPLLDDDPVLRALDRLLKIEDTEARLSGLYAPARARVEVITEDAVEAEMAEIARQIALNDAREARPADTGSA
jgi:hypothetical protein